LHERPPPHLDRAPARDQQQPQGLASLPASRQGELLARARRACGTNRVERVVFAAQPPLVARTATALEHQLTAVAQVASKAGTVVTSTFNCPDTRARRVLVGEANRLRVAAGARPHRPLRDQPAARRANDRDRVPIAMRVDSDHVVQLVCKHHADPPTRLVGSGGRRSEHKGNRAAGL
jgi:hypothetical protein